MSDQTTPGEHTRAPDRPGDLDETDSVDGTPDESGAGRVDPSSSSKDEAEGKSAADILTVFLLSLIAVLTAWCGFESSKWGGEMSIAFSQASSARIQSTAAEAQANAARQYDLTVYTQWVLAVEAQDTDLQEFIEERFSPEFAVAFDAWDAGGREALGPFTVPEYVPPGTLESVALADRADAKFEEALDYNQRGDDYTLLTVLFALVLFLTAMSQRVNAAWMQRAMLGLAVIVALGCVITMLTYPVKI
ncbi:hypothetical protein [Occultella kanbiaonis]|uniref:hypothetical protein n=1 Tax=Occultella kanbiaonis TaxID=2675754 RepID=UPI001E58B513|nr:hypothetical protein [Occultella kanbiaonis]